MGILEESILKKITLEVKEKFPEMEDVNPVESKVSVEPEQKIFEKLGISMPKKFIDKEIIKLIYKKNIKTEDGFMIQRIVRVLVDKSGTVLKISTSK